MQTKKETEEEEERKEEETEEYSPCRPFPPRPL
jgi:hypothetical protein